MKINNNILFYGLIITLGISIYNSIDINNLKNGESTNEKKKTLTIRSTDSDGNTTTTYLVM